VATDQKASITVADIEHAGSVIENELPTYRAISATAIFSVICGALSVCAFADPLFYVFSILAVALGVKAHRTIRRYPDMLTGQRLANTGIILGLAFGLVAGTISTVQYFVRHRQAEQFARRFAVALKSPDLGDTLQFTTRPSHRAGKTNDNLVEEFDELQADPKSRTQFNQSQLADLTKLRKRLTESSDQDVQFIKLEQLGEQDSPGAQEIGIYAYALLRIEGPRTAAFPEKEQHALAILKAAPKGRQYEWWVDAVRFPFNPNTTLLPEKRVVDAKVE